MMNANRVMTTSALAALLGLAACSQSVQRASYPPSNTLTPVRTQAALTPSSPTPPAASPEVASSDLPDDGAGGVETASVAPATDAPVASVTQTAAKPVSRESMIGRWSVSADGKNCEIFLALTKWSGGYRAATRGCAGSALGAVQAWDVKDGRVVLVDASGNRAASLGKQTATLYSGASNGGGQVSFTR